MEEYLSNPFAVTPEAGKEMVITSDAPPWLHCHHKVFPAHWQCKACPPNRCFNGWDLKALLSVFPALSAVLFPPWLRGVGHQRNRACQHPERKHHGTWRRELDAKSIRSVVYVVL
jgi:hypothetical protein